MANKKGNHNGGAGSIKNNQQRANDVKDYSSLKIVLFYCSLIVLLPVATFFSLKAVLLDQFFTLTDMKSNIYSAVGAVVALHLALGLYIYRAYFGDASNSQKKVD